LCKLAYLSFHNQHKYCPVVNSTTVDYSAFWRNCNCGGQSLHAYTLPFLDHVFELNIGSRLLNNHCMD
jgi:hypothetical protein